MLETAPMCGACTCHWLPSQRTTPLTNVWFTLATLAASRSPLASGNSAAGLVSRPPIGDHAEPSQRAIQPASTPPAMPKNPEATTSPFGITARSSTNS